MGAVMEFEDFTVCYRRLKYKIDRAFPLELGLEKGVRQKLLKQWMPSSLKPANMALKATSRFGVILG